MAAATSDWLEKYNRVIVITASLIFGALFFYKGVSGFLTIVRKHRRRFLFTSSHCTTYRRRRKRFHGQKSEQTSKVAVKPDGNEFFNRHWLALEQGVGGHASTAVLKRLGTYTAIFGIIHALLYFASYYFLQSIPLGSATDAQIIDYYMNGDQRQLVIAGMYMMPFAGICSLYFMVFLRTLAGSTGVEISSILVHRATAGRDDLYRPVLHGCRGVDLDRSRSAVCQRRDGPELCPPIAPL